jgi:hypothetical protein
MKKTLVMGTLRLSPSGGEMPPAASHVLREIRARLARN